MFILTAGCYLVIADAFSGKIKSRLEWLGLALIMFSFLISFAAALSRWDTAIDREMPIRYGMIVSLAHAGLLLASIRWIGRILDGRHAGIARAAIFVSVMALLAQQVLVGRAAVVQVERYADAWARFTTGEWTPEMTHYVHPDRARAQQVLEYLRSKHLYGQ